MRGGRCGEDIPSGARALVDEPRCVEPRDGRVVGCTPLSLQDGLTIPIDADGTKVRELRFCRARVASAIKILDPHEKASTGRAGEQPRDQRGAEVSEVELPRRARRIPAGSLLLIHQAILP